jgi:hypothetical protein
MENIFVANTNLLVLYPIIVCLNAQDFVTAYTIGFVGFASFISHLAENHKHGMRGVGFSIQTSFLLNRLDVLGCILLIIRLAQLYYTRHGLTLSISNLHIIQILFVITLNLISEYDNQNIKLKSRYIITHSLWHISVFITIGNMYHTYLI